MLAESRISRTRDKGTVNKKGSSLPPGFVPTGTVATLKSYKYGSAFCMLLHCRGPAPCQHHRASTTPNPPVRRPRITGRVKERASEMGFRALVFYLSILPGHLLAGSCSSSSPDSKCHSFRSVSASDRLTAGLFSDRVRTAAVPQEGCNASPSMTHLSLAGSSAKLARGSCSGMRLGCSTLPHTVVSNHMRTQLVVENRCLGGHIGGTTFSGI